MRYPIAIQIGNEATAFGVIPDLAGAIWVLVEIACDIG